jgi:hypothetical protein
VRRILLALIALLIVWALVLAVTPGIDLRPYGIRFKSTDPVRVAYAALALILIYIAAYREDARKHLAWFEEGTRRRLAAVERHAAQAAILLAVVTGMLGVVYGILVAGGSDSYGYISQADLWLAGDLVTEQPIATQVPWPDADWTFAPLGYRNALEPGAIVPVYAPGLPVLMAAAKFVVGGCGPYLIVPILGGLMVWLTFCLGVQLWSRLLGLGAAALMATSPAFLFMLMNPMADVPASALFLAGLVIALSSWRTRALWTGVVVSLAICVRPNLVPLGAVFLGLLIVGAPRGQRWGAFVSFSIGGLPLVAAVAAVNSYLYGAPWKAGYGTLDQLYRWEWLVPNLTRYCEWLLRTETPLVVLSVVPLVAFRIFARERRVALIGLALFIAAVWLCYLWYEPFDAWWYLRFLLPAFPPMLVMAAIGFWFVLRRVGGPHGALTLGVMIALPVLVLRVATIREEGIFNIWQGGVVYASAAAYVDKGLPPNAIILTVQHSGSIRHYSRRLTLRWDVLEAAWWPRALEILAERGYRPYLLISSFEEAQLRRKFRFSDAEDAPGTVVAVMDRPEQIRIYDPLREPHAAADTIPEVIACPCGSFGR